MLEKVFNPATGLWEQASIGGVSTSDMQAYVNAQVATAVAAAITGKRDTTAPIIISHSFLVGGSIAIPSGDTDYIPPVFIPVPAGRTAKLRACRHRINSGTSVTAKLQIAPGAGGAFADATGFTGMSITTAATTTDPTDITLTDNDVIMLVVTAISGSPKNLSMSLYVEYT